MQLLAQFATHTDKTCAITIGNTSTVYTYIVCMYLTKDLVTGSDMQQIYCIGCDWTEKGQMYGSFSNYTRFIHSLISISESSNSSKVFIS